MRATRVTYVGELGWELYVPAEFAVGVFDLLHEAGREFGLANAGYYAINALRLEKGYRAFGAELNPDYNPVEAGLLFATSSRRTSRSSAARPSRRRGPPACGAGSCRSCSTIPR